MSIGLLYWVFIIIIDSAFCWGFSIKSNVKKV